jgi:VWFA-related protein
MGPEEAERARVAIRDFLETGVASGDRVALVGTWEGTRWTARMPQGREALLEVLDRLQGRLVNRTVRDRMTDWEAMRIARFNDPLVADVVMRRWLETGEIYQDTASSGNPTDPSSDVGGWRAEVHSRAANVYARTSTLNEQTYAVVEREVEALAAAPGRKTLVFASGGLVADPNLAGPRRVVTAARRVNAAVYFVDARGLVGASFEMHAENPRRTFFQDLGFTLFTETQERSEGSEGLAADTGGFSLKNTNDLADGLARIGREARSYYLLGYTPTNRVEDGRFREIQVKVTRERVTVRARRGYFAPGGEGEGVPRTEGRDAAIQRALDAPFDLDEVPLRAIVDAFGEASSGKSTVQVTVEADIRALEFREKGDTARDTLEFLLVVAHQETGEYTRFDQQFEMTLGPDTRARYEGTWFPITREMELAPGLHQARIVARDQNSGKIGSLTYDFEVPGAEGLRVSGLILSDRVREDSGDGTPGPELIARRHFAPSGVLHCRFEVYGAALDPRTGLPKVTAGLSVRRSDGRFLAAMAETPLQPDPDGALARSLGLPLDGAPAGTYELIVVVTDVVAKRAADAREPFVIEGESGS